MNHKKVDLKGRCYQDEEGQWYFNLRGNHTRGPYPNRKQAEQAFMSSLDRLWHMGVPLYRARDRRSRQRDPSKRSTAWARLWPRAG